jgi:hypothetical protein
LVDYLNIKRPREGTEASGRMKRRIGDRRGKPRFEIIGDLWGSIDATESLLVPNLGRGGALVESPVPLAPESMHWVTAMAENQPHLMQIRVRHSQPLTLPDGQTRFLIGVEFVKLSPGIEEAIVRYMGEADGGTSVEAERGR